MSKEAIWWSCTEVELLTIEDVDEAVESYLDGLDVSEWPAVVTVTGYAPEDPPSAKDIAERITEDFDNWCYELCNPDGDSLVTPKMREAALECAKVFVAECRVWRCEPVDERKVNTADWVREHRDNWIAESAEVAAFVAPLAHAGTGAYGSGNTAI